MQIASVDHPLEVVIGFVCPVLVLDQKEYILSFYRDILPMGWLIPGGCPSTFEELFHPRTVASREACEEVLITDANGVVYHPEVANIDAGHIARENCSAWRLEPTAMQFVQLEEFTPESTQVRDASSIVFLLDGEEVRVENVAVTIDPEIASASIVLYWKMHLPISLSELRLFDGEKLPDGTLLNRPVRLTPVEGGDPIVIFSRGQSILAADWITEAQRRQVSIR